MNPKYYRTDIRKDRTTVCPWCSRVNRHMTGDNCEHVYKVTAKGLVFYYWGIRPERTPNTRIT